MKLSSIRRVHFVGIGGIGMSGIAEVLLTSGFEVAGSDLGENDAVRRLTTLGVPISIGHDPSNVGDAQVLVYSSAVSEDNPEVVEARKKGIPVIPRAEMLSELMRLKDSVAVAGTHGKTTVTAMISHVAHEAGLDPTVIIGGRLSSLGSSARLGKGDLMVAEADESDRSLLLLNPDLAVITNVELDHVDCYSGLEDLKESFISFANRVPFYGSCVVNGDNESVREMIPLLRRRVVTFGMSPRVDYAAAFRGSGGQGEKFVLYLKGKLKGEIEIGLQGRHNVMNAMACLAVCGELSIPFETVRAGLRSFPGVDRRFEFKGEAGAITVYDDYGHHPTEVSATLKAARRLAAGRRLVLFFQPHRFSRLAAFMDAFAGCLGEADLVIVTQVYPAGEKPLAGINGETLVRKIAERGHENVHFCGLVKDLPAFAAPLLEEGDLVITMGAGTITNAAAELLRLLEEAP